MKPLSPTQKERKRYILFEIISDKAIEKVDVSRLVMKAGLQFLGELGMARSGLQFVPETWKNRKGIIRTGHKFVDETKAALALVKEFEGQKARINCLKVSGTIEKLNEERE